jgi:hypothetical protein
MSFAPYPFHTHVPITLATHTGRAPRGSAWCTKSIGALQEERTQARSEGHTGECCEAEIQIVGQEALPVAQPWGHPVACTEYGVPVTVSHHRIHNPSPRRHVTMSHNQLRPPIVECLDCTTDSSSLPILHTQFTSEQSCRRPCITSDASLALPFPFLELPGRASDVGAVIINGNNLFYLVRIRQSTKIIRFFDLVEFGQLDGIPHGARAAARTTEDESTTIVALWGRDTRNQRVL